MTLKTSLSSILLHIPFTLLHRIVSLSWIKLLGTLVSSMYVHHYLSSLIIKVIFVVCANLMSFKFSLFLTLLYIFRINSVFIDFCRVLMNMGCVFTTTTRISTCIPPPKKWISIETIQWFLHTPSLNLFQNNYPPQV